MKKINPLLFLLIFSNLIYGQQGVSISTTGNPPSPSAMLDVRSNDKGLLIPQVSLTARNVASPIASPANSLLIYNISTSGTTPNNVFPGFYYWNKTTMEWERVITGTIVDSDNQGLTSASISGTMLTIDIEDGTSTSVDLENVLTTAGTDNQNINGSNLSGTNLTIGIEDGANQTINLAPLVSNEWHTIGNTGTSSSNNFIGTLDNTPLTFRINNIQKLRLDPNGTLVPLNTGGSVFIGIDAGVNDDLTGNSNVFIGNQAGQVTTSGASNVGVGGNNLALNTTGKRNTSIGRYTLNQNTTGAFNTAIGYDALGDNTTGNSNIAIGNLSLNENITGNSNVAVGSSGLGNLTSGEHNIALGHSAVAANGNGGGVPASFNDVIGIGYFTFSDKSVGNFSVAMGTRACGGETTGSANVGIGYYAQWSNTSGNFNTAIGHRAGTSGVATAYENTTGLGANTVINASNKVRIGDINVTVIEGQVAYSFPSDARFKERISEDVPGLDFVLGLRPITYNFNTKKFDEFLLNDIPTSEKAEITGTKNYQESMELRHSGFIAQEVEALSKKLNYDFDGVHIPKNERENYSVSYSTFVVPLVKAVQEQQEAIEQLKKKDRESVSDIKELKSKIKALEKIVSSLSTEK